MYSNIVTLCFHVHFIEFYCFSLRVLYVFNVKHIAHIVYQQTSHVVHNYQLKVYFCICLYVHVHHLACHLSVDLTLSFIIWHPIVFFSSHVCSYGQVNSVAPTMHCFPYCTIVLLFVLCVSEHLTSSAHVLNMSFSLYHPVRETAFCGSYICSCITVVQTFLQLASCGC